MGATLAERLEGELAASGASALLIVGAGSGDADLAPFLGAAHLGDCFVLATAGVVRLGFLSPIEREQAEATGLELLTPADLDVARAARKTRSRGELWAWVLERGLQRAGLAATQVALAGHPALGFLDEALAALRRDGWRFVSGHEAVLRLRKRKSAVEVAEIAAVAGATCEAFRGVAATLAAAVDREGELWGADGRLTVGDLRRGVALALAGYGLSQPEGSLIAPGAEGAVPHNTGRDATVLRAGESLIVDLFPCRRMYADCTRTFCVGAPGERLQEAWGAVREALELARRCCRAGVRGWTVQEQVCRFFEDRGYPTVLSDEGTTRGYVHGLAHGVGFQVHEYPEFRRESDDASGRVEVGDVLTLEPGLYDPEAGFAVRLEDLVHVGDGGLENLTPLPYEMNPRAWGR